VTSLGKRLSPLGSPSARIRSNQASANTSTPEPSPGQMLKSQSHSSSLTVSVPNSSPTLISNALISSSMISMSKFSLPIVAAVVARFETIVSGLPTAPSSHKTA